jgi:site-specific recombinase XerD
VLQNAPHGGIATPRLATSAAHKGSSLDKLQVVLGHADITTTRLYVQTSGLEVAVEMAEWF